MTFIRFLNTVLLFLFLSQSGSQVREGNAVYNLEVIHLFLIFKLKSVFWYDEYLTYQIAESLRRAILHLCYQTSFFKMLEYPLGILCNLAVYCDFSSLALETNDFLQVALLPLPVFSTIIFLVMYSFPVNLYNLSIVFKVIINFKLE